MSDWGIVLLGALGFLTALGVDVAALAGLRRGKQLVGLLSAGLMGYALVRAAPAQPKLALPAALAWLGWPLLLAATALLVYSLFLEIPFRRTYVEAGASFALVRTGTYALTRHPGVLWLALLLVALLLVSRSRLLLWAGPIWLGLDVLAVSIQDRFSLPRQFPDYAEYRQQTPMLLPTLTSVRRCWRTLRSPVSSTDAERTQKETKYHEQDH
jgi:protein-S-isoprenylcysteine O-methyltransferase Ste14